MPKEENSTVSATRDAARYRRYFIAAVAGTILVAVCCFTPLLVLLVVAVGLSALTPYLDYVLFPALAAFFVLTIVSYRMWKISCGWADPQRR